MSEGITASQLADGVVTVLSRTVTLSNAQIKALPSTAVDILSSVEVPAGKQAFPLQAIFDLDSEAAAYTNVSAGGYLAIAYIAGGQELMFVYDDVPDSHLEFSSAFGNAFRTVRMLVPAAYFSADNQTTTNREYAYNPSDGFKVKVFNGGGNFTGGNAANTLNLTVLYTTIDV